MTKVVSIYVSKNFELINLAKRPACQLMHQVFSQIIFCVNINFATRKRYHLY